ncbi:MAG: purine-nucleoside phosphorylase [Kiritimatiellales bacterium]
MNSKDKIQLEEAAHAVKKIWPDAKPRAGIVLGSGWGGTIKDFRIKDHIPYGKIPHLGLTGVTGHTGNLIRAEFREREVFIFQGRRHYYEGAGWVPVVLPVWIMKQFGIKRVLLTNAAGGIREYLKPGTLVAIEDHISFVAGNPLIGPHDPVFGERFPDQTTVYHPPLRRSLMKAGVESCGTYVMTAGPMFETPAEIYAYRVLGADMVGMSTVPEAQLASALGMRVAGLSCICNWAAGIREKKLSHSDIEKTAAKAMPRMREVLRNFVLQLRRK